MEQIKFLLKFGEREFMERMACGYFYFSNAEKFRELEDLLQKKGQGDCLEGTSKIHGTSMEIFDKNTSKLVKKTLSQTVIFNYEAASNIPVYCLFACYNDNCIKISSDTYKLSLDRQVIDDIKLHFDKADTVAIITNPKQFIEDIQKKFFGTAKTETVNYFHIEGTPIEKNVAQDLGYLKYLTQDSVNKRSDGKSVYSLKAKNIYRCLFCKDIYFQNEQEYRILLPEITITSPKEFQIPLTSPIKLFDIDKILSGEPFII